MQRQIEAAVHLGFVMLANRPLYSHLYLEGLRMLMRIQEREQPTRARQSFEFASHQRRLDLLRTVVRLTMNWPLDFVDQCAALPHVHTTVAGSKETRPYWVESVLRGQLLTKRSPVSKLEADSIAAVVARQGASKAGILKAAKALSGRDLAHWLRPSQVSPYTTDELIEWIDQEIAKRHGTRKNLLLRDKVMFIAARGLQLTMPKLLSIHIESIPKLGNGAFSFCDRIDAKSAVFVMLEWYVQQVRPVLKSGKTSAVFTSNKGTALTCTALGMRFDRAIRSAGLDREVFTWMRWTRVGVKRL